MIKVIYARDNHKVSIEGHARNGEIGHDIVCAAVSALTYTLAANVENLKENKQTVGVSIKLDKGNACIKCIPRKEYRHIVFIIIDSICAGYELLAQNYPENVSYEIV